MRNYSSRTGRRYSTYSDEVGRTNHSHAIDFCIRRFHRVGRSCEASSRRESATSEMTLRTRKTKLPQRIAKKSKTLFRCTMCVFSGEGVKPAVDPSLTSSRARFQLVFLTTTQDPKSSARNRNIIVAKLASDASQVQLSTGLEAKQPDSNRPLAKTPLSSVHSRSFLDRWSKKQLQIQYRRSAIFSLTSVNNPVFRQSCRSNLEVSIATRLDRIQ